MPPPPFKLNKQAPTEQAESICNYSVEKMVSNLLKDHAVLVAGTVTTDQKSL